MKIVLGSENPDKIKIVKNALEELHLNIEVEGVKVDSGVTNQPLDKEATKQDAINHAKNAKKKNPDADFWIGLEGGLHDWDEGYHLVTFACLVDQNGNEYVDQGEEIHLPDEVSEKVKKGEWFGDATREYAKGHKIDENLVTRLSPFSQAVQNVYTEYLKIYAKLGYRKKVSGIVKDSDSKYLIVQLIDYSEDHWNWPGGGMEVGETAEETIIRELKEELGTDRFEILKVSKIVNKYDWPNYVIAKRLKAEGKTWRGQEVAHIQLKFMGDKVDIKPDPGEIKHIKWVEYKDLESHFVIPNQWKVAKKVILI
jgi:inosine/xanthosine triphosphatase